VNLIIDWKSLIIIREVNKLWNKMASQQNNVESWKNRFDQIYFSFENIPTSFLMRSDLCYLKYYAWYEIDILHIPV
jgi:hypothetical protein